MKQFLKIGSSLFFGGLLLAAVIAALVVLVGAWIPNLPPSILVMGDETIAWPQSGAATSVWIIAWLAIWLALVISALAILFAFTVTGGTLILVGLLMFAPVLLLAGFIAWLLRRANRSDRGKDADPHSSLTTPSPSVGSA